MSQSTTQPSKLTAAAAATTTPTAATAAVPTERKRRMPPRRRKRLTPKQKLVKESAQQRFKTEKLVFVWQEKLFSQSTISTATLNSASLYLQPKTYNEVIEERVVQEWCGYPLCSNQPRRSMQRFKISLKQRKVFDQTEIANFCSDGCYYKSKYYSMQLSEEPVWFRDLDTMPHVHVITLEQDFKTAVNEAKGKRQQQKSSVEIRQEYVQQLLSNVPKDTKSQFEIIEKTTVEPTKRPTLEDGVYDSIEGYRIEVKKSDGKSPSTMILRKKKKEEIEKEKEEEKKKKEKEESKDQEFDPEDPDALFETMMMLKDMNMDKEEQPPASNTTTNTTTTTTTSIQKQQEQNPEKATKVPKHVRFKEEEEKGSDDNKGKEKEGEKRKESSTAPLSSSSSPSPSSLSSETSLNKKQQGNKKDTTTDNNAPIQVKAPQKAPKNNNNIHNSTSNKKKKKNVPELSLFGTIWTMLDHMTTKATRTYLTALQNNQDVDIPTLMENETMLVDDASYVRGQIFSEKILETYAMIRSQLHLSINMENDMISVMKTFRFSDASMVALNPAQCYMMTLVFIKALADASIQENADWKIQFENCCKTVDQSSDMVDACVRVLKVASV